MAFRRPAQGRAAGIDYLKPAIADKVAMKATATAHARPLHIAYEEVVMENKLEKEKKGKK